MKRVLVLFVILTFWYWFSLYFRRERHESSRSDRVWYWIHYFGHYRDWDQIVWAEFLLIPLTYLMVFALSYVFSGSANFGISLIITCVLWIAFYAGETGYHHYLKDYSGFDIADIPWFVMISLTLDIIGIVLSILTLIQGH